MAISQRNPMIRARTERIPKEVQNFCAEHGIGQLLRDALRLVRRSFRPMRKLEVRLQPDPDADETRVVIDVTVETEIPKALAMQRAYTDRWVKLAPLQVRDQIRLLYNLK